MRLDARLHYGEPLNMKYVHLELKICESCGILWLRRKQNDRTTHCDGNYCAGCTERLAAFPAPGKRGGGRPRSVAPRTRTRTRRNRGCAAAKAGAR